MTVFKVEILGAKIGGMALTNEIFAVLIAFCLVTAAFPEWMGKLGVRMIAASPGPVRRFYGAAGLGHPLDGPLWNSYRRMGGLLMGLLLLALLVVFSIFGFQWL